MLGLGFAVLTLVTGCRVDLFDSFGADESADSVAEIADDSDGSLPPDSDDGSDVDGADTDDDPTLFDVHHHESPTSSCETAARFPSHLGCEFFGIDLDQPGLFDYDPYGFVIINPANEVVEVVLERYDGETWRTTDSALIEPEQAHVFLPPDMHKRQTGLFDGAVLRIRSDLPVMAIQASPASGEGFSASAALLQPSSAWTTETRVAGWRTHIGVGESAYLGVVALSDFTPASVELSFDVMPGEEDPVDAWLDPVQRMLRPGQLLRLSATETEAEVDHGISGSRVYSGQEHRTSVFSAHSCAAIPEYEGWCGHMQEHLAARLVGRHFVAPRLVAQVDVMGDDVPELIHEPTLFQVIANEPNTEVQVLHGVGELVDAAVIDPHEPFGIYSDERDLAIVSDKPVIVSAYMANAQYTDQGSPSMVQLAPVELWTTRHWVWVPEGFTTHLLVLSAKGTLFEIEPVAGLPGQPLPNTPMEPLGGSFVIAEGVGSRQLSRWSVGPGIYRVEGDSPISVVVAGFGPMDGFAYLGGWGPSWEDLGPPI